MARARSWRSARGSTWLASNGADIRSTRSRFATEPGSRCRRATQLAPTRALSLRGWRAIGKAGCRGAEPLGTRAHRVYFPRPNHCRRDAMNEMNERLRARMQKGAAELLEPGENVVCGVSNL